MSRSLFIWVLIVGAGLLAVMVLASETRVDTRIRLERTGDQPFDAEVFYTALSEWVGAPVTPVDEPAFTRLADSTLTNTTYLFLSRGFAPGEEESERLLRFVARGNTVFVAAHALGGPMFDRLGAPGDSAFDGRRGLRTQWASDGSWLQNGRLGREDTLALAAPGVEGRYGFPVGVERAELTGIDSSRSRIVGWGESEADITLVRVRYGRGEVIVSSAPLAFTNAALTGEGDAEAYLAGVLALLPQQPILWDDYTKPYREQAQTPLRYILVTPSLAWAYWIGLVLLVLLLLFRGRRWQRPIPIVTPPPNAQREFARTVGRLHFNHGDTGRLFERKVRVFKDRLRTRLRLPDPDLSDETARRAAPRAGVPEEEAEALFAQFRRLDRQSAPAGADLVDLDMRLARFFRHVDPTLASGDAPEPADASGGAPVTTP